MPLSREADGLGQFVSVHAAKGDGVSPQSFTEGLLADEQRPERVLTQGQDDGQEPPVAKVAQLAEDRAAFPFPGPAPPRTGR